MVFAKLTRREFFLRFSTLMSWQWRTQQVDPQRTALSPWATVSSFSWDKTKHLQNHNLWAQQVPQVFTNILKLPYSSPASPDRHSSHEEQDLKVTLWELPRSHHKQQSSTTRDFVWHRREKKNLNKWAGWGLFSAAKPSSWLYQFVYCWIKLQVTCATEGARYACWCLIILHFL